MTADGGKLELMVVLVEAAVEVELVMLCFRGLGFDCLV